MDHFHSQLLTYWMLFVFAIGKIWKKDGNIWRNMEQLGIDMKKHEKSGLKMPTVDVVLFDGFTLFSILPDKVEIKMIKMKHH